MNKPIILLLVAVLFLYGCAPVNMLTRLKKTPREYSENYQIEGIKAPPSEVHKKPWVVYSDRADNAAFVNPGGKVKSAEVKFAEPFLVIGTKGEYLELIKYKSENIKNNQLNERKKAEYVGWIHRSRLLLSPTSITDIRSGLKDKMMTVISDSAVVFHPHRYFTVADTLKAFTDPALSKQSATLGLHQIVYVMKKSADGKSALVTRSPSLSIDKATEQIVGWVPHIVLQDIGRQVFSKTNLSEGYPQPPLLQYSPVIRPYKVDSMQSFLSGVFYPIIDKSENKVYNIDGKGISYGQSSQIKADLKRINVIFAIESSSKLPEQYPLLLNVIQNLTPLFSHKGDVFEYRFGASVSIGTTVVNIPLTSDYSTVVDSLTSLAARIEQSKTEQQTWSSLQSSLKLLYSDSLSTNLIVVTGETAGAQEMAQSSIIANLNALNCRILGIQLYASGENSYNNFVLQLTSMIDDYALCRNTKKREITMFADQVCRENRFVEPVKNFYMLDYPTRSMTQGGVLFPEKGEFLSLEIISGAMDSILTQICSDNTMLSSSIDRAFTSVGNGKDKYDSRFASQFSIPSSTRLSDDFKKMYDGKAPVWYSQTGRISTFDSLMNYHLMLSEVELEATKNILEALCAKEVDVKDKTKRKKGNKSQTLCEYLEEMEQMTDEQIAALSLPQDSIAVDTVYVNTRGIRKHLIGVYLSELGQCRVCKKSVRKLEMMSLSQAHRQLFGIPSNHPLLDSITIKELKNKKYVSDAQLDSIIRYFKLCKEQFESKSADEKAASATENYYYIDAKLLP